MFFQFANAFLQTNFKIIFNTFPNFLITLLILILITDLQRFKNKEKKKPAGY